MLDEEIREVIFEMQPSKAPGIDGLNASFSKKKWDTIGSSVCDFVKIKRLWQVANWLVG